MGTMFTASLRYIWHKKLTERSRQDGNLAGEEQETHLQGSNMAVQMQSTYVLNSLYIGGFRVQMTEIFENQALEVS